MSTNKNPKLKFEAIAERAKKASTEFLRKTAKLTDGMAQDLALLDRQAREAEKVLTKEEKRFTDAMDAEVLKLFAE